MAIRILDEKDKIELQEEISKARNSANEAANEAGMAKTAANEAKTAANSVAEDLTGKVDKIKNTNSYLCAYVESPSKGTTLYGMNTGAVKNSIPIRVDGGAVAVGPPSEGRHAINHEYFYLKIGPMQAQIDILKNSITEIESWIDLHNDVVVESNDNGIIVIPKGAKPYACILEIHGQEEEIYWSYELHQYVINYPKRIETDTGVVLFEMPNGLANKLTDFGIQRNYIYFEDGRTYYHQGARLAESYYDEPLEGEQEINRINDTALIFALAEPIVTDITDLLTFDPVFNIEGCEHISIVPLYTKNDLYAMSEQYTSQEEGDMSRAEVFNWKMPKIKIAFEV